MLDTLQAIGNDLKSLINNINTFNDYFWHPSHLLKPLWLKLCNDSFNIFLFLSLSGFVLFCVGYKKGSKITIGSMAAYFLIKYLSKAI